MTWNEKAENWLELARHGHDPNEADTERVRRALVARGVIVAGGIAGGVATSAGAAASAITVKALAVQASAALLVAGSMVTATTLLFDATRVVPAAPAPVAPAPAPSSVAAPAAFAGASPSSEAKGASTTPRAGEPTSLMNDAPSTTATLASPSRLARPTPAPSSSRNAPLASRASPAGHGSGGYSGTLSPALEREIAGLRSAQQALHRGEVESAARALDQLERTSPEGAMLEERLATRTILSCSSGDAPDALRTFLASYPTSVHRERVRAACVTKPAVGRFPETGSTGQEH